MTEPTTADRDAAIDRGVAWVLGRQAADGAWRSETYGTFAGGVAPTAHLLEALVDVMASGPTVDRPAVAAAVERAVAFLKGGLRHERGIVAADGTADYPTYATALVLLADRRRAGMEDAARGGRGGLLADGERAALTGYLRRVQLTSAQGFDPSGPHHGGWDAVGERDARGVTHGSSLSVTALVVEALTSTPDGLATPGRAAAAGWIAACQAVTGGGGFAFNPDPETDLNKAGVDAGTGRPIAYGTMTLDGLRAATALTPEVPASVAEAAWAWLAERARFDRVPGFAAEPVDPWSEALIHYWFAGWGRLLPRLPEDRTAPIRGPLLTAVLAGQRADGSWQNASALMREDDPLVATGLALTALAGLRRPKIAARSE